MEKNMTSIIETSQLENFKENQTIGKELAKESENRDIAEKRNFNKRMKPKVGFNYRLGSLMNYLRTNATEQGLARRPTEWLIDIGIKSIPSQRRSESEWLFNEWDYIQEFLGSRPKNARPITSETYLKAQFKEWFKEVTSENNPSENKPKVGVKLETCIKDFLKTLSANGHSHELAINKLNTMLANAKAKKVA
jgi:hypothetical protein